MAGRTWTGKGRVAKAGPERNLSGRCSRNGGMTLGIGHCRLEFYSSGMRSQTQMRKFMIPIVTSAMMFGLASLAPAQKKGDAAKGKEVFEQCAVCHNTDTDEKK